MLLPGAINVAGSNKGCCRDLFEMVVRKKKIKVKNQSRKIVSLKI